MLKKVIRKSLNVLGYEIRRKSRTAKAISSIQMYQQGAQAQEFRRLFYINLGATRWEPHPLYSVFTQYDQDFYLKQKDEFMHKYRCFYAVSKTIAPRQIIELGTHAGSSADAYLSAAPEAEYIGIDQFNNGILKGAIHQVTKAPRNPREIATELFKDRGFTNYRLIEADLRALITLPTTADMVVVDAAHDFDNEYADLNLALTAKPTYIFVDDAADENQAKPAIEKFIDENLQGLVEYVVEIDYIGGGLVIKLK